MTREVVVKPRARADVLEMAIAMAVDTVDAAIKFVDAFESTIVWLADEPHVGRARGFRRVDRRGVRSWAIQGFPNHLVFYTVAARQVFIVRVLHGARDLPAALLEPES